MPALPRHGIRDHCVPCLGWGAYTVGNSTDYEDELECLSCGGTGIRRTEGDER